MFCNSEALFTLQKFSSLQKFHINIHIIINYHLFIHFKLYFTALKRVVLLAKKCEIRRMFKK